jgi:DNA ligase (NAD+)
MSDDKKQTHCTNINCPAQLRARITHYASREGMDIDGLGDKRAQQLLDAGLVEKVSDLYTLTEDDLLSLERFAEKSAQNLLSSIQNSLESTLSRFLYALGIPLVGVHLARVLARNYRSLDDVREVSREQLLEIDEIGPEVARSVSTFFEDQNNREVIREIRGAGLDLENTQYLSEGEELPLEGLTLVFTGGLDSWTRDEIKSKVESLGARATSSVSGETDYLIAGPGAGSKLDDARDLDVPVLDEEEFKDLLQERTRAS